MVMLVWGILALFGVCEFTWLPVLIDAVISIVIMIFTDDTGIGATISACVAHFAFYKFFFGLTISPWWILLSPVVIIVSILFPGGCTIFNILLQRWNLISLPTWGLIVGIVLDVIYVIAIIYGVVQTIIDRKKEKENPDRNRTEKKSSYENIITVQSNDIRQQNFTPIYARCSGTVLKLKVSVGQIVNIGDILMMTNSEDNAIISAHVPGRIDRINVRESDVVNEDTMVAVIARVE